ncbi:PHD finger protein 20 isoform X1 [Dryobates pubescens]|uniref:PHD finger protein 20 isoform X1 n=1 Tax=Dryobates pubescens TaxID=118200 RepID=UPI0023B9EAC9|nr:PHD finger protein 20 isoform X1 [Dryobates pubescens]
MTKHPPNRRGINFEVGAQLEARDRLKNWYPAHIEEIDYEEGKVLIHFKRWNHRYDEWFCWDSPYLRPLEKIQLRKEGLHEEEGCAGFHINDQVLACWSDCRFYPAKVTAVNKDGTYTVKFYDGVVQTVKNIHVKAFSKDQNGVGNAKPKERGNEIPSSPEKQERFKEQRKTGNAKKDKDEKTLKTERRVKQPDKEGKLIVISEKGKVCEKNLSKNGKEDKENISENDMEYSVDTEIEKKPENDNVKSPQENTKEAKRKRGRPPVTPTEPSSQTLQPITLELRRRKIPKGAEVPSKRPRIDRHLSQEKLKNSSDNPERDQVRRRSSRLSSSIGHEILTADHVTTSAAIQPLKDAECNQQESEKVQLEVPVESDQSFSEEGSPGNTALSAALGTDASLQEEKAEDTEPGSVTARAQEPSPSAVTKSCRRADFLASVRAATVDQDHKFRCKFLDCSKSFRKAKLLHYHMKYFHGVEKAAESQQSPVQRNIQTRASLASEKANQERSKRGRSAAGSLYAPLHIALRSTPYRDEKIERRRSSAPVSALSSHRHAVREQAKSRIARALRRPPDAAVVEHAVVEHEKSKESKSKDYGRPKSKKKKKKKKRSKPEYSGSEEVTEASPELSPDKAVVTKCFPSTKSFAQTSALLPCSDSGQHRGKSKAHEDDTLSESSLDSLLWSDDDCSQDVDVTNPEEEAEESDFEIVRCVCEVKEENDFMIQCEECLCWQHGVCMGLLEDNVPEKYTCYVCQDPPGQRSSLKYWYEKEWLSNGHMHGLAFLEENYSHQNAKKIVATHQLLGDVQRVIEVLHGLQLKMSILQNKEHPDLKLWCHPWKHITVDEKLHGKHIIHIEESCCKEETASYRAWNGTAEKPSTVPAVEESYITSEHCYQKPRAYYPAIEQRLVVETRGSAMDDGVNRLRENGEDALSERLGWDLDREICKMETESKLSYSKVRESVSKKGFPEEAIEMKLLEKEKEGVVNSQLQWQLNLLAHVESLQDEVIHRMDFIEKELDVLESWLDYTGELEPPEPLARLPQLKHCIKQLITDLGKVQQIALCCST